MPSQIKIESVLGGHAPTTHFSRADQFRGSMAIDPSLPIKDVPLTPASMGPSGLLRPTASQKASSTTITNPPIWLKTNPKDSLVYVLDSAGSVYTIDPGNLMTTTALSDAGNIAAGGSGCEYYDNYMYFATNTDITRYGPLNGSPTFNGGSYWHTTLGKSNLLNTVYPPDYRTSGAFKYPNHVMHRHIDALYIADVVGNKGTIHMIKTTKTTVEGDTDNGSTEGKLVFGPGLWPTALESYGNNLAIALFEGTVAGNTRQAPAKIAFWDTTSQNYNTMTWVEFPDAIITAMKNINGVLYVFSSNLNATGFRITRFVGGYTYEEVEYIEQGQAPFPGGVDGNSQRLLAGSWADTPETGGCVYSIQGLQKAKLSKGLFNIMRSSGGGGDSVCSLALISRVASGNTNFNFQSPLIGWSSGVASGANNGVDFGGAIYNNATPVWWSQMFRVGQRFKIRKIRIPFATPIGANNTLIAKIYTDDGNGTTYTYQTINNTNYPNSDVQVVLRSDSSGVLPEGFHNFWLELRWGGSALLVVGLPIMIEYELYEDDE